MQPEKVKCDRSERTFYQKATVFIAVWPVELFHQKVEQRGREGNEKLAEKFDP